MQTSRAVCLYFFENGMLKYVNIFIFGGVFSLYFSSEFVLILCVHVEHSEIYYGRICMRLSIESNATISIFVCNTEKKSNLYTK